MAGRPGYELNPQHWPAEIVGACASRLVSSTRTAPAKAFGAVHLMDMELADMSATHLRAWLAQRGAARHVGHVSTAMAAAEAQSTDDIPI